MAGIPAVGRIVGAGTLSVALALAASVSSPQATQLARAAGPAAQPATGPYPAIASQLLPDLITVPPFDISIATTTTGKGKNKTTETRLRLSNGIANRGSGALELFPTSADCDGDGDVLNDRLVMQRIFEDTNGNSIFDRGADQVALERPVGCSVFHPQHHHWHIEDFARYDLYRGPTLVATAEKVSFCVIDTDHLYPADPGSPSASYYRTCGRTATLGLSVGWADVYTYGLAGQYIVISGVADGDYCLLSTADPGGGIAESNESNNSAGTRVTIAGNRTTVTSAGTCSV